MLTLETLPTSVREQVSCRLRRRDLARWLAQVQQVGHCARPIRLVGSCDTINAFTGEVVGSYASSSEPDAVTYLRRGNRRRAVCPSCSHQYQGDVFHVIMAGAAGGMKDVPADVAGHPLIFATLTAPSFGPVHTAKKPGRGGSRRCRPRSGEGRQLCVHGRPRWCMAVHDHRDSQVGQPLCADCYDYPGQAVWQWHAPELWRRFTIKLWRGIAGHLGVSETACKALVRVQFAKVVEFQRRGIVHYHALIRLDGAPTAEQRFPPPAVQLKADLLADLAVRAAGQVEYDAPPVDGADSPRRLRFGRQVDARPVHDQADRENTGGAQLHPETVSAYVAKYATKAAADLIPADGGPNPHPRRLKTVVGSLALRAHLAGQTGTDGAYKGW